VLDEVLKYVHGAAPSAQYNTFLNLAINLVLQSEPMEPLRQRAQEWDEALGCATRLCDDRPFLTCWDRLAVSAAEHGLCTVQDIVDQLEETYGIEVTSLSTPTELLFSDINPATQPFLQRALADVSTTFPLQLNVDGEDPDDGTCVLLPTIEIQ
jgi:hypothetical protein